MNRYLITGGSGFIGTNLMEHHLRAGDTVLNFDISPPRDSAQIEHWRPGSLLDLHRLKEVVTAFRPTHIYHLAARTDLDGKSVEEYRANTLGVRNLIDVCKLQPQLERVLFASSRLVCEIGHVPISYEDYCPSTPYGESKVVGEQLIMNMGPVHWSWTIFRPTSIWGPWFGVPYRNFFDAVRKRQYFHPLGLSVLKSFGYVGNAVFQISSLMGDGSVHARTFYVGDYEPIDVLPFATLVAKRFDVGSPREAPLACLRLAAWAGELLPIVVSPKL